MIFQKSKRFTWWQIALAAVVVSAIGGLTSGIKKKSEKKLYDVDLKQAPWAPPGWLFGPAWTFNNFFILMALQSILKSSDPNKNKLLAMQVGIWVIFFSFGYVYFNRKSPLLAAVWTISDAALALTSFIIAYKREQKLAFNYLPLLVWTSFASSLAVYQSLYNSDPVFGTDKLIEGIK